MHPNALLEAATDLVHRVLRFEHPADRVVADFFRESRSLGSRERHTLTDTVFNVLRELPLLRHLARSGSGEQERRLVLLAWQGNAGFLRAAMGEVEIGWLERSRTLPRDGLPDTLRHNLPDWFAERMQVQLGEEFWPWAEAINQPAPLDLRVNVAKASRDEALARLRAAGIVADATAHSPVGIRVEGKPALQKLEIYTDGWIEVQDEGSQLLASIAGARRGEMVVDFCAGAGGKTLALGAQMRNTGRLYAFDISGHRLAALTPRLARSGLSNVYPVQIAHERDDRIKRLAGKIDRVLVDAPCTGLGTLRRNPD
ncbi:MAG: RsmB/NOP family class I SAM-dependent RNA methyltransferase, partial [Caldimonas sp.]